MALPYHIFILATQHSKFAEVLPIAAASGFILLIIVLLIRILLTFTVGGFNDGFEN